VKEALEDITSPALSMLVEAANAKAGYRKTVVVPAPGEEVNWLVDVLASHALHDDSRVQQIIHRLKDRLRDSVVREAINKLYEEVEVFADKPPAFQEVASSDDAHPEPVEAAPVAVVDLSVYGIISAPEEAALAHLARVDDALRTVTHQGLVAIVSETPATKEAQAVVLGQMTRAGHIMLPVRVGMVLQGEQQVADMLSTHYLILDRALSYLRNEREWVVQVYCDRAVLLRAVLESDRRFESMVDSMVMTLHERATSVPKIQINSWAEAAIEVTDSPPEAVLVNIIENCQKHTHQVLSKAADDNVIHRSAGDGVMILEAAYLVPPDREDVFRLVLEGLGDKYKSLGFMYRSDGPHIPTHFAFRNRPIF